MEATEQKQEEERLWLATWEEASHHAPAFVARYRLASHSVSGKSVCDCACGAGYGSAYLSRSASEVVGIDASEEAIHWASDHYHQANLQYVHVQADAPWPLERCFDVVTSFETMEHTSAPDAFLRNIIDHLTPGGQLVMSVPNGPLDRLRNNPFHLHHFTGEELKGLIEALFGQADYYSQTYQKDLTHYATKPLRKLKGYDSHRAANYCFESGLREEAKNWLVLATKTNDPVI